MLNRRGIPEEAAEEILERFSDVCLIDDAAFAHAWVESRQRRKNLSRRALRSELVKKGIDRELIDEALSEVDSDDEYAAALTLATSRLRRLEGLAPEVRWRRLTGALARKGFSAGLVMRVAREVIQDADTDLESP